LRTEELEESQRKFRQAQKMEALGTLVGGIAHDFNNILASILAETYLAKRSLDNQDATKRSLSRVDDLGFRAADMIKQLLAFSRHEEVKKMSMPLTSFFKEASKMVHTGIEASINYTATASDDRLYVNANSTQLQQVLFNLVNNARDAVAHVKHPEIRVNLSRFEAEDSFVKLHPEIGPSSHFALIEVRDNGEGVPEEYIDRLFEPFFTTKETGKGTGLGLAMVYSTIKDHKGILEVQSKPDVGSLFKLYLPLLEEEENHLKVQEDEVMLASGETILLVDDEVQFLETSSTILKELGYNTLVANNGKEALEIYAANPDQIDLVMLDVVMPEMSGPDAAVEMRRINPNVKIIFQTGYDTRRQSKSALDQSTELVLNKPSPIGYISRIIREQLD